MFVALGHTQFPWFSMLDINCPQFRAYGAALIAIPMLSVTLSLAPGIARATRAMNTVVPRAALPVLFMRLVPALHVATAWVAATIMYQLLGNVLLMFALLLFIGACGCGPTSVAQPCVCVAWFVRLHV